MKRLHETTEILIFDPVAANRNATRASLYALGFRKVELAPSLEILRGRVKSRAPDLLLAEVTGNEADVCQAIQAVRQGRLGDNPFIVVLATSWRRDGTIVSQVLNSGADDLVARPVSTAGLGERIKSLSGRRKGFVVTADYIGPDRRRRNAGADPSLVPVPNPLEMRAREHLPESLIERDIACAIQRGKDLLNAHRLERTAVQLCLQWRMRDQGLSPSAGLCRVLPRMAELIAEMKHLAALTGTRGAALDCCESIAQSLHALMAAPPGADEDLELGECGRALCRLEDAVLRLGRMFAPDVAEPAALVDLDQLCASHRQAAA